jgi:hypothetical protein
MGAYYRTPDDRLNPVVTGASTQEDGILPRPSVLEHSRAALKYRFTRTSDLRDVEGHG